MATQYSNKPIVTDGLVYALDFGNPKSYVSGSATAQSLIYRPTPARFETLLPGDYGTPAAAYSVRKVVSSYTGSAMMVQSASVSQSIGFDANGNLDTASLASFAGSGDAFVRIWYDQSGNGRHASQTTTANQPKIYSGSQGSVVLENGKPTLYFDGSNDRLDTSVNTGITGDFSFFSVFSGLSSSINLERGIVRINGFTNGLVIERLTYDPGFFTVFLANAQVNAATGELPIGGFPYKLGSIVRKQNNFYQSYLNNSQSVNLSSGGMVTGTITDTSMNIGDTYGYWLGNIAEIILYPTEQSTGRPYIENNINNYYTVYTPTTDTNPTPTTNFLNFTSPDTLKTQQTFPGFSYNQGNSTIMYVGETKGNSTIFTQDGTLSIVSTTSSVGFGSPSNTFGRNYPVTGLKHVTLRFSSGSVDCFVNGIPVSASAIFPTGSSIAGGQLNIPLYTGSLGGFQIYNRPLTSDEIWNNYQLTAPRYGLGPVQNKPYTLDENAYLFLQSAGITDPIITGSIDTFVRGLKSASLWDKMIAIYPFVGTGSTGINLTGSHRWNLKEPSLVTYPLTFTGSWIGSTSGSAPSGSGTNITMGGVTPTTLYPFYNTQSAHISILSYDTPVSSSYLMGTGMTEDLAVSTLAGDYGTPAAAYSVRKVRTAYSGALMDVRRDLDNTTGSFGFDTLGNLDTGSLLAFVTGSEGTGSGFVARWYDQSGNNRHASQTATGSQPLIVLSGSVILEPTSSKPALRFDGVDDWLRNSTIPGIAGSTPVSIFTIGRPFSVTPYPYLYDIGSQDIILYYPPNKHTLYRGNDLATSANATINTTYLYNLLYNSTNSELKVNGSTTTGSVDTLATSGQITLGAEGGSTPAGGTYFSGSIPEFILYTSNMGGNREPIEYNINNYYNIYPQTSSFATSSFTIKADSGSISASLNNRLTSGIAASGPLGLITVSRTGSNSLTIARNGVTSSFAVPASGALSTGLYLGAINNNGIAVGNSPVNISFASVGTGLNEIDLQNQKRLVWGLQYNLGRNKNITTQSLILNLDSSNRTSYPGSGNTWFDLSGNSNNGTLTNGPIFNTSDEGSIVFDGSDDYVQVPNNITLNSNTGSLSIWFKPSSSSFGTAVLIGKADSAGSYNGLNILVTNNSVLGQLKGVSDVIISGSSIIPNTWNNFTVTYASGVSYSSYLNGSLIGTNTLPTFTFSTQPLRIARSLDSFWATYKGEISNVLIYSRILNATEVSQNFNAIRGRYGV